MQDIHDIRLPVQVGVDFSWVLPVAIGIAVILVLLVLFIIVRKWMRQRNNNPDNKLLPEPLSPFDAAMRELDALSGNAVNNLRLFYFDLTLLLRKYIGATCQIHAVEMTSQQFLSCLRKLDLDEKQKSRIAEFYKNCDPYKYAGVVPGASQIQTDLEIVRGMITQIEKQAADAIEASAQVTARNPLALNDETLKGDA